MPVIIPTTTDGDRKVTCEIGGQHFVFRTYWTTGQESIWLLDIFDINEEPLMVGLAILPGSDNILKGHGDTMKGYQLFVLAMDNKPGDPEALSNTVLLIMYSPGEENWFMPGDPLIDIDTNLTI